MIGKSKAVMAGPSACLRAADRATPGSHESAIARIDSYRRRRAIAWMPRSSRGMTAVFGEGLA